MVTPQHADAAEDVEAVLKQIARTQPLRPAVLLQAFMRWETDRGAKDTPAPRATVSGAEVQQDLMAQRRLIDGIRVIAAFRDLKTLPLIPAAVGAGGEHPQQVSERALARRPGGATVELYDGWRED